VDARAAGTPVVARAKEVAIVSFGELIEEEELA
jgi:hypothetical protein